MAPLSRFWEWLGWKSRKISESRTRDRADRSAAEVKLTITLTRAAKSASMSDWLRQRSEQNHIAEALGSVFDHPRRRAT